MQGKGKLNLNQRTAVRHKDGPMLVLAGPGSGKTTVIINRIYALLRLYGVPPEKILTITFTKAAAVEMETRFKKICPNIRGVHFSTFHALFFRMLREKRGITLESVIDEGRKKAFIRKTVEEYCADCEDIEEMGDVFPMNLSLLKNNLDNLKSFKPRDMKLQEFLAVYKVYEAHKRRNELIDFDDMTAMAYELLTEDSEYLSTQQKKYDYILIDEFQDINKAQYECIRLMAEPKNNIFAVGDDDQSIYGFRGASPQFMLDFEKYYKDKGGKTILLDTNYRSAENIIRLGGRLISNNKNRFEKDIKGTGRGKGSVKFMLNCSPSDEADGIAEMIEKLHNEEGVPYGDMAVIYRNNLSSNAFAHRLILRNIPYYLRDNTYNVYDHWIAKDIRAYVDFVDNTDDNDAFFRIVNKPGRMVSKRLLMKADTLSGSVFYNVINADDLTGLAEKNMRILYETVQLARKKQGFERIKYIYDECDYEMYLEDYAAFKKCSVAFLRQIAAEVLSVGREVSDTRLFGRKLDEYKRNITGKAVKARNADAVTLTTMHSAKGLEFGTVFVPSLVDMIVPNGSAKLRGETEEERRLFYVASTRARDRLIFSSYTGQENGEYVRLSPFLEEIGIKTLEENENDRDKGSK